MVGATTLKQFKCKDIEAFYDMTYDAHESGKIPKAKQYFAKMNMDQKKDFLRSITDKTVYDFFFDLL